MAFDTENSLLNVGDRILLKRGGFLCTSFHEFADRHNLYKFVKDYDPSLDDNDHDLDIDFPIIPPILGRVVVKDGHYIGIDIGHHHIIASSPDRYRQDWELITTPEIKLEDDLFAI